MPSLSFALVALLAISSLAHSQSNQNPDLDVFLADIRDLRSLGRLGTFPNGANGIAFETTICNQGAVTVPWLAAMDPAHPFIAFLIARESGGRLVQISDRSFVKHGFNAANSTLCSTCTLPPPPSGTALGLGCSDTYRVNTNGNRFWLGPAEEIDPWLGIWDRTCSQFDRGEPSVGAPNDCDNARSLTQQQVNQLDGVAHRIEVGDAELNREGLFHYQSQYVVAAEAEGVRGDNLGSRPFSRQWSGAEWILTTTGPLVIGPVLERWSGATVTSNTNGAADGRVFVAVKVTGPVRGVYHYEYAVQNRDNLRGVGALRIPICDEARVFGFGFRDIDGNPANDWTATLGSQEIVFSTSSNPLRWNSLYNFWFDSDAAPESAALTLDAFAVGGGSPTFDVPSTAPTGLYNVSIGSGCGSGQPPALFATGSPPRATLGNAGFGVSSAGLTPGTQNVLLLGMGARGPLPSGCRVFARSSPTNLLHAVVGPGGIAAYSLPIPNDLTLEGLAMDVQSLSLRAGPNAKFGLVQLSNGLRVRMGNAISGCP